MVVRVVGLALVIWFCSGMVHPAGTPITAMAHAPFATPEAGASQACVGVEQFKQDMLAAAAPFLEVNARRAGRMSPEQGAAIAASIERSLPAIEQVFVPAGVQGYYDEFVAYMEFIGQMAQLIAEDGVDAVAPYLGEIQTRQQQLIAAQRAANTICPGLIEPNVPGSISAQNSRRRW